ncbi:MULTISPECIES: hypothetical protein [Gemmobacter]|jgi:hypothetical protein|uniref:Response regulatory domain-containing protein n=2 Tax=Gemmobacter TaxID=204456 RepID=A0A2T6ASI0_9RHOB|nr:MULTISPECIES: hypothetical protein [Gemmobacter]OJY25527.1 MAG: hypothetical protein BGP11_07045 [Rhodobacterales bacterium 65-51]PTX46775.1 hypothetical protein C8N34_11530 [Gemmobacter caeni]TWI95751.1 hypothetical protein IQ03_03606 [Gemmobacter caeni]GHC23837.1 hypothetical protein GCM10007291_24310 [Gemmobacter nanjingensis]
MQMFRPMEEDAALVGWGVRVLLLADPMSNRTEEIMRRVAGFGGLVEEQHELFAAMSALLDDPAGYGMLMMDCDVFGGLEAGRRALSLLRGSGLRIPAILLSSEVKGGQTFPEDRMEPILLRAPVSAVSLRVGFEHALRERLVWRAA